MMCFLIIDPEERFQRYWQFDHVRKYGRDYVQRMEGAGFRVTEDAMTDRLSDEDVFRYGLNRKELVHAGTK